MEKKTPEAHLNIEHDLYDSAKYEQMRSKLDLLSEVEKKGKDDLEIFPEFLQDSFNSLFKYAPKFKNPIDVKPKYQLNRNLLVDAMNSNEWKQLRAYTRLDEVQSATATATMGNLILKDKAGEIEELNKYLKAIKKVSKSHKVVSKQITKLKKKLSKSTSPKQQRQLQKQMKSLKTTLTKQNKQINNMQQKKTQAQAQIGKINVQKLMGKTLEATKFQESFFGWGNDDGIFKPTTYKDRIALSNQILKNPNLIRIAKLAGKFRRLAVKKQKTKTTHAFEEISD